MRLEKGKICYIYIWTYIAPLRIVPTLLIVFFNIAIGSILGEVCNLGLYVRQRMYLNKHSPTSSSSDDCIEIPNNQVRIQSFNMGYTSNAELQLNISYETNSPILKIQGMNRRYEAYFGE